MSARAAAEIAYAGEKFGQKRPPLSVTIKQILDRYPDGQIFKELIQNADDAGAKMIQFYVDSRTHGTKSLVHPDLGACQGPALLSVNDAAFSDEDWKGIQSLQLSDKVDDPFKAGQFGIGFCSVYHLTDGPVIISGEKVGYLEPQERIWKGKSGRAFTLKELQNTDNLAPFNGISGFASSGMMSYSKTIFRFPLRKKPSDLSQALYDVSKIDALINALREEAKLLLVFLRSVHTIEVVNISKDGDQKLSFKVEISDEFKSCVKCERQNLLDKLKLEYLSESYNISRYFSYTSKFNIKVSGIDLKNSVTSWLVCNQVGSDNKAVLDSAVKQKILPWVGIALELTETPESARIFCFLPLPVEAASNLPVHVNGTFVPTDDRRSLKWPGVERQNDPKANWNIMLVKDILPRCYVTLLREAKDHLNSNQFYKAWPCESIIDKNTWGRMLKPLYMSLFEHPMFWSETSREWVEASLGVFVQKDAEVDEVIHQCLLSCDMKVVSIKQCDNVWAALKLAGVKVTSVSPKLVRDRLKDNTTYTNFCRNVKCAILDYCLSDGKYSDLLGLHLLPLLNGKFAQFQEDVPSIYVASESCPSLLLPNLTHMLIDLAGENLPLHKKVSQLAQSPATQVRMISQNEMPNLLDKNMPAYLKKCELILMPDSSFPVEWFESLWNWVEKRKLNAFVDKFILPVAPRRKDAQIPKVKFCVVKLPAPKDSASKAASSKEASSKAASSKAASSKGACRKDTTLKAVIYIPSGHECSVMMKEALDRLEIYICCEDDFPYVKHRSLSTHLEQYDASGVLGAIDSTPNSSEVKLTDSEAEALRDFIKPSGLSIRRKKVLEKLSIFRTAPNTKHSLLSVHQAKSNSTLKKAVVVPQNTCIDISKLPSSMIMFSQDDHSQIQLLKSMAQSVDFPSDNQFILNYLFPMLEEGSLSSELIDEIMICILHNFHAFRSVEISKKVKNFPFVKISTNSEARSCPKDLYDPRNCEISEIFKDEHLFPMSPYDKEEYLDILKKCGLKTVIKSEKILDVIRTIGTPSKPKPQRVHKTVLTRARAVLQYICKEEFLHSLANRESFKNDIKKLSTERSWIPVLSAPPSTLNYPSMLPWRGANCKSHLMSLQAHPYYILSTTDCDRVPLLVGSQMYLSDPPLIATVADMFPPSCSNFTNFIVSHLVSLTKFNQNTSSIANQLFLLYQELAKPGNKEHVKQHCQSLSRWLYIPKQRCFVSPSAVAIKPNPTFYRHNLDPYIYLLPEQFADFKELFLEFGMHKQISESQIISVLEKIKREIGRKELAIDRSEASDLIMSILNWLTKNGSRDISNLDADIYIPVESDSSLEQLQLENVKHVVYSDSDFLKEFASSESVSPLLFSHSSIHQKLAECLGLRLLSEEMDISEDAFEDTGQHEPLTQRLKNILKWFKDGLTIIKELLQNADDAEATEFNICYDSRCHNTKKERLLFQGMSQVHGPALVVHNNKTFSDKDFINITKLAGATKENEQLKIGKFGEGFCSVYHITDVPSFVSRDQLHIFDPTLMCLNKEVKNPNKPGKRMRFTTKVITQSDQLNPYVGLFGFEKTSSFKGTLFRLPFRTCASELSLMCYNEETIKDLICEMQMCASKLLLFLQHVNHVTFWRIDQGQTEPKVLFEITKSSVESLSKHAKLLSIVLNSPTHYSADTSEHWLVAKSEETIGGKQATASVACSMKCVTSSMFTVMSDMKGEMFCFLPLSQHTGLPVHISGNFAVMNNRRGIWASDETRNRSNSEIKWNIAVMKSVVPKAYKELLATLQQMHTRKCLNKYFFYGLWPLQSSLTIRNPWFELLSPLYHLMTTSSLLLSANNKWLSLRQSKILKFGILSLQSDTEAPECVLKTLTHLDNPLVNMPAEYHQCLLLSPDDDIMITEEKFVKWFFQKLGDFVGIKDTRNEVLLILLKIYASECDNKTERSIVLHDFLKKYPCIPTSPDGTLLKRCGELISPDSRFASLYDKSDGFFPDKKLAERQFSRTAFLNLGMIKDTISPNMLIERAQTIPTMIKENKFMALHRVKTILKFIESDFESNETLSKISEIQFLPVLPKPDGYPLSWKGEGSELSTGSNLVHARKQDVHLDSLDNTNIAGSQVMFLCEHPPEKGGCGSISQCVLQNLQISTYPSCLSVVNQLKEVINVFSSKNPQWIGRMCDQVYSFLDKEVEASEKEIPSLGELEKIPWIWNGTKFIYTHQVAKNWKMNGPYLFAVPRGLRDRRCLCEALQIKEEFSGEDVTSALQEMKNDFGDEVLDNENKAFLKQLMPLLDTAKPDKHSDFKVLLPDESFILRWSDKLVYDDAQFAPHDDKYTYVNSIVSSHLANQLLIKSVSSEVLDQYSKSSQNFGGIKLGESEKVTDRIKNILLGYPFDVTVLKELLQNADEAKATKMYVILDKRFHGKKSVFSERWQKLQGPALLVWNNSTFSKKDLNNIQRLGLGSRRGNFQSIGQYGVGFNAVYHLTDCPSLVTGDNSLSIFDPHCHFIGGATLKNPGKMFSAEIWEKYPDVKSAYLRSEVQDICKIQGGTLFRFPLRHSTELVEMSEIIDKVVTAKKMRRLLKSWAPQMKNAMIFLNHVIEMKFIVIEEDMNIVTECHFKTRVNSAAQKDRDQLHKNVLHFKLKHSNSYNIHYRMTLESTIGGEAVEENWIVQQGLGDVNVQHREWKLVKLIKPRHGIAAPFEISSQSCAASTQPEEKGGFAGQVFCSLPLQIGESKLPVHIIGSFVLNPTRLDLFSTPGTDETQWNENLLKAIGSSYEKFLTGIKEYFFPEPVYKSWSPLLESIHNFYNLFPNMRANLNQRWMSLSQDVYSKLVKFNSHIVVVIERDFLQLNPSAGRSEVLRVRYSSCGTDSSVVYFWKSRENQEHDVKTIKPILEKLGMVITSAPVCLMDALNEVHGSTKHVELLATSPQTVCLYYMENYSRCSQARFPCAISKSSFETVEAFKKFTLYTLCENTFAKSPFGYPLLLTEDGQLRNFDESNKVVKSRFAGVFSRACQSKFIHCQMFDVPYSSSYFASPADKQECLRAVLGIFQTHVPEVLHSQESVDNSAERILSRDTQKKLWKCLNEDETFKEFLYDITEQFAIIPSTSGTLFSSKSPLQPVSASPGDFQHHAAEIEDLKSIGLPFIDDDIVCTEIGNRPHWNDPDKLLETLYYLFQKSDFTHLMNKSLACRIIDLVKNSNFRKDEVRKFATSLPLYETIDGKFTCLHHNVLMWPSHNTACETAYLKWAQHVDDTFLKPTARTWTDLATPEDLGIKRISEEELYMDFVFPHFSSFTDNERFLHLKHIRDQLYRPNKHKISQNYDPNKQKMAKDFIFALGNLKCLTADGTLRKVSEFCNHEEAIFRIFSHQFMFLPKCYREGEEEREWIDLFNDMGLRQAVNKEEYLKFCTQVSNGSHSHLCEASDVLVQYLFSSTVHDWHKDADFLFQVSRISFVMVKAMSSLNWIAKQAISNILSFMDGNTDVWLAAPFYCALPECSNLLWTVKPIVDFHLPQIPSQAILQGLMVTEDASPADVVTNVFNICVSSSLTDFSLFDAYPEALKPPHGATGLVEVMVEMFQCLMKSSYDVKALRSLPCVPVPSTPQANSKWQWVLVKPCFVLSCKVEGLHPYLRKLPEELLCVLPLMVKIGIKNGIELSHVQAILSKAYSQTDGVKMEANTRTCVIEAVKHLKKILQNEQEKLEDSEEILSPLYLPGSDGKLHLSTAMVYIDASAYKRRLHLDMRDTKYTELQILPCSYGFTSSDLCSIVPQEIRPIKLSEICKQYVTSSCEEVADTSVTLRIRTTFKVSLISEAVLKLFAHYMKDEEIEAKRKSFVTEFFSNLKVLTVENLKTTFKLIETGVDIGEEKVNFFFDNSQCCLYLDSAINVPFNEKVIHDLSDYIILELTEVHPSTGPEVIKQIRDILMLLFNAQTDSQMEAVLKAEGINIANQSHDVEFPMPELGKEIPVCWHYRLDQDIDNIFYPTEWVGYEDRENHIIFVQIGYPILPNEQADFDTIPRLLMKYMIHTRKDDLCGTPVSGLDLLKFIRGKAKFEDPEHLESTKEKVSLELTNIWSLPVQLEKKAVRRLYLKWQNPDESSFSAKVFNFMLSKIKHHEDQTNPPHHRQGVTSNLSYNYPSWQDTSENLYYWRRQKHSHEGGQANYGNFSPFGHVDSNKSEGWRWVKQADVDYRMLVQISDLAQSDPDLQGYGLVCYLSHQVSEKALQGGVYAICGKDERNITDHSLSRRAHMLKARKPRRTNGLLHHVTTLDDYYLKPRYPNWWEHDTGIPADHYTASQAKDAVDSAKFVLGMVKDLMPVVHGN